MPRISLRKCHFSAAELQTSIRPSASTARCVRSNVPDSPTDTPSREFKRHAVNYLLGGGAASVISVGPTSLLTRTLTVGEYGILQIFLSIIPVFGVLVEWNIRGAVNRYYLEETDDFPDFLKSCIYFLGGLSVVNLGIFWMLRAPLGRFYEISPTLFYLGVVGAVATVPWNLNWKLFVAQMKSAAFSRLRVIRDALLLVVSAIWLFSLPETPAAGAPARHLAVVYATLVVNLSVGLWLMVRLLRIASAGRVQRRHLVYAISFGLPLIPHALSGFVLTFFDRIVVIQVEGDEAAGLYSFAYQVGMGVNMIVVAMNQAWLPIFIRARNREQYPLIDAMAWRYAAAVSALSLVVVLFAQEAAMILGDERYMAALPLVPIVVLGYVAVFMYTMYSNYSFYLRRTILISAATLVAAVANVVLNYVFVPRYGFVAAAWTTLACYLLMFAMHYIVARVVLNERVPPLLPQLAAFGAAALAAAAFTALQQRIDDYWTTLLLVKLPLAALVVGVFLHFRDRLKAAVDDDPTPSAGGSARA